MLRCLQPLLRRALARQALRLTFIQPAVAARRGLKAQGAIAMSGTGGSDAPQPAAAAPPPAAAAATPPHKPAQTIKFCRQCGSGMQLLVPEGDTHYRHVCSACSFVDYINPRMVVGCLVEHEGRLLLLRRGIQPQCGFWTVPAGFMELNESTAEGAARETMEEVGARVSVLAPYAHFDVPVIGQSYVLFRAALATPYSFAAQAPESLEARLFAPEEIPWDELAFSSVALALRFYVEDMASGTWRHHHGTIVKEPGSGFGDYRLINHFAVQTLPAAR